MQYLLILLTLLSISFSKNNTYIGIHGGLGNIHSHNLASVSIGYDFETAFLCDRINLNWSAGFLPYMPTFGHNFLMKWDHRKDREFISGLSIEYNKAFGIERSDLEIAVPFAYKMKFDYDSDFQTFLIGGFKWANQFYETQSDSGIGARPSSKVFISILVEFKMLQLLRELGHNF